MKLNELAGIGNHNTTLFWEYSPQVGRRWNLDPVVKPWESRYSAFGDNPLTNFDFLGDKWKNASDVAMAKRLTKKIERRISRLEKRADKFENRAKKLAEKGKTDQANKFRERALDARQGVEELNKSIQDLDDMSKSLTEFTYKWVSDPYVSEHHTYMDGTGTVIMEYGNDATAVHETTHGHQEITGELQMIPGTNQASYIDATDEAKAYKRQYYFDPTSVTGIATSPHQTIIKGDDITANWVMKLCTINKDGSITFGYKNQIPLGPVNVPPPPSPKQQPNNK